MHGDLSIRFRFSLNSGDQVKELIFQSIILLLRRKVNNFHEILDGNNIKFRNIMFNKTVCNKEADDHQKFPRCNDGNDDLIE